MFESTIKFILDGWEDTVRFQQQDEGDLIGLPYPYTVPSKDEDFQEMYYWDTYFTNVGLLACGNTKQAKNNVDNILFLVERYGLMPNANLFSFLDRSQPPVLSLMVRELFEATNDRKWLGRAYVTLKKEYSFWQEKRCLANGLNGYTGYKIDSERLERIASYGLTRLGYRPEVMDEEAKKTIYLALKSFCESGWDCNSRFLEKPHEFNHVDLNSLLYGMEENMLYFSGVLENGEQTLWKERMDTRMKKMQTLWSEDEGIFKDYHPVEERYSDYTSAASLYPLFCGLATQEQAESTRRVLDKLELPYGISCGESDPAWGAQWDYPYIWAPIQLIAYRAMIRYGFHEDAERLARKYIDLIERNFEKTGNLWEKYDGITGQTVNAEYDAPKMLGWTSGVYIYFSKLLKSNSDFGNHTMEVFEE